MMARERFFHSFPVQIGVSGRVFLFLALLGLATGSQAQNACTHFTFTHNYPVRDTDAYFPLFNAVEDYRPGPKRNLPWPFAKDNDITYPAQDFCPKNSNDRLVRLFQVGAGTSFRPGTLTLVTRDLAAARKAASELAAGKVRDSEFQGRTSIYFTDAMGNEFFIWQYPGPPGG